MHGEHDVAPAEPECVPAGQSWQALAPHPFLPSELYDPGLQAGGSGHCVELIDGQYSLIAPHRLEVASGC